MNRYWIYSRTTSPLFSSFHKRIFQMVLHDRVTSMIDYKDPVRIHLSVISSLSFVIKRYCNKGLLRMMINYIPPSKVCKTKPLYVFVRFIYLFPFTKRPLLFYYSLLFNIFKEVLLCPSLMKLLLTL